MTGPPATDAADAVPEITQLALDPDVAPGRFSVASRPIKIGEFRRPRGVGCRGWGRAYAPEPNPTEGVWSHINHGLGNLAAHGTDRLTAIVRTRVPRRPLGPPQSVQPLSAFLGDLLAIPRLSDGDHSLYGAPGPFRDERIDIYLVDTLAQGA
jgi:hypothetical protein